MIYIGEKRKRGGRIFFGGRARVGGLGGDLRRFFLEQQALEENLSGKRTEETKRAIATKAVQVCTSLLLEF